MRRDRRSAGSAVAATSLAVALIAVPAFIRPPIVVTWNASASVPLGLYAMQTSEHLQIADLVVVRPPEALATFLVERRYIGAGVPMLKHVAALSGQTVCRDGFVVTVDGIVMAQAHARDRLGRALPVWDGCRTLGDGDVFLLNPDEAASLDGRYFGPLPHITVIGRAIPLWTNRER